MFFFFQIEGEGHDFWQEILPIFTRNASTTSDSLANIFYWRQVTLLSDRKHYPLVSKPVHPGTRTDPVSILSRFGLAESTRLFP